MILQFWSRLMLIKAIVQVYLINIYGTGSKSTKVLLPRSVCAAKEIILTVVTA